MLGRGVDIHGGEAGRDLVGVVSGCLGGVSPHAGGFPVGPQDSSFVSGAGCAGLAEGGDPNLEDAGWDVEEPRWEAVVVAGPVDEVGAEGAFCLLDLRQGGLADAQGMGQVLLGQPQQLPECEQPTPVRQQLGHQSSSSASRIS